VKQPRKNIAFFCRCYRVSILRTVTFCLRMFQTNFGLLFLCW